MQAALLSNRSRVFEHADPHAVSGYVNEHVGNHCLALPTTSLPSASLDHRKLASLDLCRISYGAQVRVTSDALDSLYHMQVLLRGHCLWRTQGSEQQLLPGELILINPDDPVDLTYSADCEKFIVKVPKPLLESICEEHRWSYPREGMRFANSRYRFDELEGFRSLLGLVCQEAEVAQSIPRVQQHYAHIVVTKMLSLMHTNLNRLGSGGESAAFERIVQFIELNLKLDMGCEALARQASLSLRSLYMLFERNAQTTPKDYIRQRKLERIHGCLSDPRCSVGNVTEIAMDYGFVHLGRFAESYRKQFGELPSQTFKRRALACEK